MTKFTKKQIEIANRLAVAYSAYNEARHERMAAKTRDAVMSALNSEIIFGGVILDIQTTTNIVLVADIARWHASSKARFDSEGGNDWLAEQVAKREARVAA